MTAAPFTRFRDKMTFITSVLNMGLFAFLLGRYPHDIYYHYISIAIPILIMIRFYFYY
jgi:hypothetical protein